MSGIPSATCVPKAPSHQLTSHHQSANLWLAQSQWQSIRNENISGCDLLKLLLVAKILQQLGMRRLQTEGWIYKNLWSCRFSSCKAVLTKCVVNIKILKGSCWQWWELSKVMPVLIAPAAAYGEAEEDREAPSPAEASAKQQSESPPPPPLSHPPSTNHSFHCLPALPYNPVLLCWSLC